MIECPPSRRLQISSAALHVAAGVALVVTLEIAGLAGVPLVAWNAWRAHGTLARPVMVRCDGPGRWQVGHDRAPQPPAMLGTGTFVLGPVCQLRLGSRAWLLDVGLLADPDRRRLRAAVSWMP